MSKMALAPNIGPDWTICPDWAEYLRFRDAFAAMLDPRFYTVDWLDMQILGGAMRLFSAGDSAILVSVRTYPTGARELHAEAATGELKAIRASLIPQFEAFGRSQGCDIAVVESRAGWEKIMRQHGYERHQVSVRKAL